MASGIFYPAVGSDDGGVLWGAFSNNQMFLVIGVAGSGAGNFVRFPTVTIPTGASITEAFIRYTAYQSNTAVTCNVKCHMNDHDDAVAPTNLAEFNALALTSGVNWDDLPSWADGNSYDTSSIISEVQAIVDRPAWSSGNAMIVVIKDNSASAIRYGSSIEHSASEKAELHVTWTIPPSEINLTEPLSSETSIQSDIGIIVTNTQLSSDVSMLVGSVFVGTIVDCVSPLTGTTSLQSDAEISIPSISLNAQGEILSNAQINIPSVNFTSTSLMSVGEILQAYLVDCPLPFSAQANLQSSLQLVVTQSSFNSNGSLYVQPEIQLFAGSLPATGSILAIITDPFSVAIIPRVYTFTLTGADDGVDDIVIPIKSFQSRLKSGDPTYLSVVIPGTNYASEINLRLNGDLVVRMGYLSNNEIILSEIISIVDFENIIIYDGTINKTITLDGHRTETFTPKEINLTGSSYKNITAGKSRYRCTPNLYVRPGDTVNIDDDSFTIENITYSVSPELETFEVSE